MMVRRNGRFAKTNKPGNSGQFGKKLDSVIANEDSLNIPLLLYVVVPAFVIVVVAFTLLGLWYKYRYKRRGNKRFKEENDEGPPSNQQLMELEQISPDGAARSEDEYKPNHLYTYIDHIPNHSPERMVDRNRNTSTSSNVSRITLSSEQQGYCYITPGNAVLVFENTNPFATCNTSTCTSPSVKQDDGYLIPVNAVGEYDSLNFGTHKPPVRYHRLKHQNMWKRM
ncbi:unnamed protein product [Owenia fusiformis]|uniref:Uncharacterized protein n=1 Tax=Owenia fusiformis TaxID=6347 RepID=A0A8S4PLH0_OWEFU|nr:unnamed protein product [Owenia fusiformis]